MSIPNSFQSLPDVSTLPLPCGGFFLREYGTFCPSLSGDYNIHNILSMLPPLCHFPDLESAYYIVGFSQILFLLLHN